MKKLIATVAAVATLAMAANAYETVTTNGVTWAYTVVDSTAHTVSLGTGVQPSAANLSAGNCIPWETVIDASQIPWTFTVDGTLYTVTRIGNFAFYRCAVMTGVPEIPSVVTYIGTSAFEGCTSLSGNFSFPDGISENIPNNVFYNCSGLTGVLEIPDSFSNTFGNYMFYGNGYSAIIAGSGTVQIGRFFASACTNLKGAWVKGRTRSNYTKVSLYDTFKSSTSMKVALFGWTTEYFDYVSGHPMFGGVTGCKVFVPANGKWTSPYFGGTSTDAIYYGANTNLNVAVDESANTITFTPTDETALVKALEAAPLFKDAFGWNAKVNVTNTIEVSSGTITSEMLEDVEFNTLLLTFAVTTQAQLDDILEKFPATTYPMLAIDVKPSGSGKTEALTLPSNRELWVHLPGDGKYTPKYNGLIISLF